MKVLSLLLKNLVNTDLSLIEQFAKPRYHEILDQGNLHFRSKIFPSTTTEYFNWKLLCHRWNGQTLDEWTMKQCIPFLCVIFLRSQVFKDFPIDENESHAVTGENKM